MKKMLTVANVLFMLVCTYLLAGCAEEKRTQLEAIIESGKIRVVTRSSPTTYFMGENGATGLEYEMAKRFAAYLGLDLEIILARSNAEIFSMIENDEADLVAAALSSHYQTQNKLMFGSSYHWVTQQLIYRNGQRRPISLADIYPAHLDLAVGTLQTGRLQQLEKKYPSLSVRIHDDKDNHALLEMIESGEIDYTLALSNELAHARQYNPEIRAAFNLSLPIPLAWAMKKSDDHSLLSLVRRFNASISKDGALADLIDRFYGHVELFDYVDSRKLVDRFARRLPEFAPLFKEAASTYDIDWRLLAAISYQESHWQANARSPTGVRGLMMLTLATAKHVGVTDRLAPEQSIQGGAKYLSELLERVPAGINEDERIWFALAAYNVGPGHLEDARILTQRQGKDPNSWEDVSLILPLLRQRKWYRQTHYGYARGDEPVRYVKNIRKYYDLLIQLTQPEPVQVSENSQDIPALVDIPLINSPVL